MGETKSTKRYFWLKLKDDFFDSIRIKKLRSIAGGDTYTIIYLKMLLKAMKNNGILEYQGVEETLAEEIAWDINESKDDIEVALQFLLSCGLAEQVDRNCFLPEAVEDVGSETDTAERKRISRQKQKQLICDNVTTMSQPCHNLSQDCHTEKEREKETETEKETEKEQRRDISPLNPPKGKSRFVKPELAEIQAYCHEHNLNVDGEAFLDYYESNGWKVGKNPMKDWKATLRNWDRKQNDRQGRETMSEKQDRIHQEYMEMWERL